MALANSGLGLAHGVAAALGIHCRVPHGAACAVMLPVALRVNAEVRQEELARLSHLLFGHSVRRSPGEAVEALIDEIEELCKRVGVPRRLGQLGVTADQTPGDRAKLPRQQHERQSPRLERRGTDGRAGADSVILSAGLTPAWQQILVFDAFHPGEVNRAVEAHWCSSGKVLNAGIAAQHLSRGSNRRGQSRSRSGENWDSPRASSLTLATVGGPPLAEIDREFTRWACRTAGSKRPPPRGSAPR